MTEDHGQGCFYRFVPDDPTDFMGTGRLQAMALDGIVDTDPDAYREEGSEWAVHWVDVADPQAAERPCRAQAQDAGVARFNRCEGSVWDGTFVWFIASTAGPTSGGQLFRSDPVAARLVLFVQVMDRSRLSMRDNLTVSPWGDLILAEDNYDNVGGATHQYLRGLTREGEVYDLARNPWNRPDHPGGEITGPCFSPDGRYLFVNIQTPVNLTLAITGPWRT